MVPAHLLGVAVGVVSVLVCGRRWYIYLCVHTYVHGVCISVWLELVSVFAHFLCVHTLVFVLAAQVYSRACMCMCTCVCRNWQVCAPEIWICMTGGQLGSPNLPAFSLLFSFPLYGFISQEQGPGGVLSHVPC